MLCLSQMTLGDYKTVLYRQEDGSWVAEVPAISGCYSLMPTREEALSELEHVFEMIAEDWRKTVVRFKNATRVHTIELRVLEVGPDRASSAGVGFAEIELQMRK